MFSFTTAKHLKFSFGLLGWLLGLVPGSFLTIQNDGVSAVPVVFAQSGAGASCGTDSGAQDLAACRQALQRDPQNVDIRVAFSDGLVRLHRYAEAVQVLRQGLELNPGETVIKQKLSLAESYLQEQLWIEKQRKQRAEGAGTSQASENNVAARRHIIRCTRLKGADALRACDEGLDKFPHNAALLAGKGDVLADLNLHGKAIAAYEEALRYGAEQEKTSRKLQLVQAKRRISVKKCRQLEGRRALEACNVALIIGAADEYDIRSRQGDLLLGLGRTQEAAQSFRSALGLRSNDSTVRQKLAALHGLSEAETSPPQKTAPSAAPKMHRAPPKKVASIKNPTPAAKSSAVLPPEAPVKKEQVKVSQVAPLEAPNAHTQDKQAAAPTAERATPHNSPPMETVFSNAPVTDGITH